MTQNITVSSLAISTSSLPNGTVGAAYSQTLAATGGTPPYTWSAPGLPAGLSLNTGTGVISGTPTTASSYGFTASATDAVGVVVSKAYSITIGTGSQTIGTISFSPTTLAVSGSTTASATATSGLAVSFSSTTPSICSVSGSTVTGVTTGTCTIAANQAGNGSYNAATQVTQNITVAPPQATSYTDNHDGTVTDAATGLTWMRCAMGQTWDGSTCTGTPSTYTWTQATALTSSFAGRSEWRLPNVRELQTIVDMTRGRPAIDPAAFPNTSMSYFWSGSSNVPDPAGAWNVDFGNGDTNTLFKTYNFYVRLVRGGQSSALLSEARPDTDYTDNGDGTVTHNPTGLMWKRCSEGQTWNGSTCTGTASTYTWDQASALTSSFAGKSDWRIPTEREQISLEDYTKYNPAINTTLFPNTPYMNFWSGSSYVLDPTYAWCVISNVGDSGGVPNGHCSCRHP